VATSEGGELGRVVAEVRRSKPSDSTLVSRLADVRSRVANVLVSACASGRLGPAVTALQSERFFGSDNDVRKRAASLLSNGAESGQLSRAVAEQERRRLVGRLLDASASGELRAVLGSVRAGGGGGGGSRRRSLVDLRARTADIMEDALASGKLEAALDSVSQRHSPCPCAGEHTELQSRLAEVLIGSSSSGKLEHALAAVALQPARPEEGLPQPERTRPEETLHSTKAEAAGCLEGALRSGELADILRTMKNANEAKIDNHRRRSAARLSNASESGRLYRALADVQVVRQARKDAGTKLMSAYSSGELRSVLQSIAEKRQAAEAKQPGCQSVAPTVPQAAEFKQSERQIAVPPVAQVAEPDMSDQKAAAPSVPQAAHPACQQAAMPLGPAQEAARALLQAISWRGQRLGMLRTQAEVIKRLIAEREVRCKEVEVMTTTAKSDLSHLSLDIEWHRRALERATERQEDLEAGLRKLRFQLDSGSRRILEQATERQGDIEASLHRARGQLDSSPRLALERATEQQGDLEASRHRVRGQLESGPRRPSSRAQTPRRASTPRLASIGTGSL